MRAKGRRIEIVERDRDLRVFRRRDGLYRIGLRNLGRLRRRLLHLESDHGPRQAQKRASNANTDLVFPFHVRSPLFR